MLSARDRHILSTLWSHGPRSRGELNRLLGIRLNTVGTLVESLIAAGWIRQTQPRPTVRGRPRTPVEIDPDRLAVIGLAFYPGGLSGQVVDLLGNTRGDPVTIATTDPAETVRLAAEYIRQTLAIAPDASPAAAIDPAPTAAARPLAATADAKAVASPTTHPPDDPNPLAASPGRSSPAIVSVGLSVTGFVDPVRRQLLLSSVAPGAGPVDLSPIYDAAGGAPIVLGNDQHALAARYRLPRKDLAGQDVLLVYLADGRVGSALLVDGSPNRGCVTGGNELGHTRFPIDTDRCFCGHTGCLEKIASTEFLRRLDPSHTGSLDDRLAAYTADDTAIDPMIDLLANGLANAVNFTRVGTLVLISDWASRGPFVNVLQHRTRSRLLPAIAERVQFRTWSHAADTPAATAAWLVLEDLFSPPQTPANRPAEAEPPTATDGHR